MNNGSASVQRLHRPPLGTRDLLPLDVMQKQWVEACLSEVFQSWGYQRVITPTLEHLSTLTAGGSIQPEAVLQVRDAEGVIFGLRPEFTASIVRAAATRMAHSPMPLRLFYLGSVFRNAQREQEFYQAGVELIGAGTWQADAETLLLLTRCLQTLQVDPWQLIIGDVGVTQSLLGLLSPTGRDVIRQAITQLDQVYLETAPLSETDRQIGLQILELRGQPATVFQRLAELSLPSSQWERVRDLEKVCTLLEQQQVELVVDLSLLQSFTNYTGLIFQAVSGQEVIGLGGRYDQLFSVYSPTQEHRPGIGFTLLLERLQRVLVQTGQLPHRAMSLHLVVPSDAAALPASLQFAQQQRQQFPQVGVELELLGRSPQEVEDYARHRQIDTITWVQSDGSFHSIPAESYLLA
jgi:ATP phosphoribosyltransferase regulatory subunit